MTVLKFELNNYFKNKSFVVTTFILAFVIAAVVIVPTMIPGLLGDDKGSEMGGNNEVVLDEEIDIFLIQAMKEVISNKYNGT